MLLKKIIPCICMLLSPIPLALAQPDSTTLPEFRGKTEASRIDEALSWIRKKTEPSQSADPAGEALESAQILFFLESHLETLKSTSFQCKNRDVEFEKSLARSLPRNADPEELKPAYREALKKLFSSLCPKHNQDSSSI